MTRPRRRPAHARTLALLLVLFAAHPAAAQRRSPGEGWLWAGAGAMFAGSLLLDRAVEGQVPEGGGTRWEWASDPLNYGGRPPVAVVAVGATWAGARLAGSPKTAEAAEHVGIALLASGVANGALKVAVGRERPAFTDDPGRFRPVNTRDRWQSFPSGHTTVAFSLAASISEEAREPWVTVATYGTATLVGWSRVYEDRHWASDVVAGALLGVVTSRYAIHRLHARRDEDDAPDAPATARVTLAPLPDGALIRITH
ncbi:MAG TPA: phosphatase PAP2 family protein [Longimicrobium sp.]